MKTVKILNYAVIGLLITLISYAPSDKFKFKKVTRDIKKEARKYEKDGWKVFAGNMPIKNQLEKTFRMQSKEDDDGFPVWLIANGSSVAQNLAAGEMQATEIAKNRLVGLIETNMKSVIEQELANNQLSSTEATSLNKAIEVSVNKVSKKLSGVQVLFKVYREVKKNQEVQVLVGYNYANAHKSVIAEMRKMKLENETEDVKKKHEDFLNSDMKRGDVQNYSGQ